MCIILSRIEANLNEEISDILQKLNWYCDTIHDKENLNPYEKKLQMTYEFSQFADAITKNETLKSHRDYPKLKFTIKQFYRGLYYFDQIKDLLWNNLHIKNGKTDHFLFASNSEIDEIKRRSVGTNRKPRSNSIWKLEVENITKMEFYIRNVQHNHEYLSATAKGEVFTMHFENERNRSEAVWKLTPLNRGLTVFMIKNMKFDWPIRQILYTKAIDAWLNCCTSQDVYLSGYYNENNLGEHWVITKTSNMD